MRIITIYICVIKPNMHLDRIMKANTGTRLLEAL